MYVMCFLGIYLWLNFILENYIMEHTESTHLSKNKRWEKNTGFFPPNIDARLAVGQFFFFFLRRQRRGDCRREQNTLIFFYLKFVVIRAHVGVFVYDIFFLCKNFQKHARGAIFSAFHALVSHVQRKEDKNISSTAENLNFFYIFFLLTLVNGGKSNRRISCGKWFFASPFFAYPVAFVIVWATIFSRDQEDKRKRIN